MKHILFVILLNCFLLSQEYNYAPQIVGYGKEKKIVVTVPSYNNERFCRKNLESIFYQNYTNYRVIYVDDASSDRTWEIANEYVQKKGMQSKVQLIHNVKNKGAMFNHYYMAHLADDDEIIVTLDGDDWFPNPNVLKRVNQAYQFADVWATYGQYQDPDNSEALGHCRAVPKETLRNGLHRKEEFLWSHLRTYYAGLFKKIPGSIFQDENNTFYKMGCDVAIMLNIIDLAQDHVYMIPDPMYVYNPENPISDCYQDHDLQLATERCIKNKTPLKPVLTWK